MARMLDLTDVFELIIDDLDDRSLALEKLVRQLQQAVAQLGNEANTMRDQELLSQRLEEIALIAKEPLDQLGYNGLRLFYKIHSARFNHNEGYISFYGT